MRLYHTSYAKKEGAAATGAEREQGRAAAGVFGSGQQAVAGGWRLVVIAEEFLHAGALYGL